MTFSAYAAPDCTLFAGRACVYLPTSPSGYLHIYHRGHYKGRSDFGADERTKSAQEALKGPAYKLESTAQKVNAIVVASGSSAVSYTPSDIAALEAKYKLSFTAITLSAHSGGYVGLNKTMGAFKPLQQKVRQILMLDNFYSTKEEGMLKVLREYQGAKVPCHGFMTDHNADRVKKFYQQNGIFCNVEGPASMDHTKSVGPFLERLL